jgi:hypothetical protein
VPDPRRIATPTDPAQLTQQAEPTPEDVERAKVAAEQDGTPLLRRLLAAVREEK